MAIRGRYIVGVDNGSQSTKVVIYDLEGNAVAEGRQVLRASRSPAARRRRASRRRPVGFDRRRQPAGAGELPGRPARDHRRRSLHHPLLQGVPASRRLARAAGHELDGHPRLPAVHAGRSAVAYATTSSGYITHRFTGEFKDTAANNILLQWPIDTDTWQWSSDPALLQQFNVRREQLFELLLPGAIAGHVTAAAAAATGIPAGLPVVVTANDKAVEALGSGSLDDRTALISLGTYIASMVHGERNRQDAQQFWTNFGCIPHRYLYESHGIRRGMWTLTWFMDLLGPEFAAAAAARGVTREHVLEQEALHVPAGCDGLMSVLDWLAPTDKPFRKGIMLGFDARHTRAHGYRSILEAIALTMKDKVDAMADELGSQLREVVISGGGSTSPLFMQIFADVFGIPASRANGPSGASLGSAICAAVATGCVSGFRDRRGAHGKAARVVRTECRQHRRVPPHERRRLPRHPQFD